MPTDDNKGSTVTGDVKPMYKTQYDRMKKEKASHNLPDEHPAAKKIDEHHTKEPQK